MTYTQARSALIENARQDLTERAIRQGESIRQSVNEAYANLTIASDLEILKSESGANNLIVISRLTQIFPENILCVHLNDSRSSKMIASNCNEVPSIVSHVWPQQKQTFFTPRQQIQVEIIFPPERAEKSYQPAESLSLDHIKLWLTAPIYDLDNQLRYTLTVKSAILNQKSRKSGSLYAYPIVINEEGLILNHILPQKIQVNIQPIISNDNLTTILDNDKFLVGYSVISNPINQKESQQWLVLAVTPLDDAIVPVLGIRRVLVLAYFGISIVLITLVFSVIHV